MMQLVAYRAFLPFPVDEWISRGVKGAQVLAAGQVCIKVNLLLCLAQETVQIKNTVP